MNTVAVYGDDKVITDIINDEFSGDFVDDAITEVRTNIFEGCKDLTEVHLPKATTIGQSAFANTGITSLTADNLPKVTTINSYAFTNSPLKSVSLPTVTSIGSYGFQNCTDLESISLPAVGALNTYTFTGCTSLTSDNIHLPNCTRILAYAFNGCTGITRVVPEMLGTITAASLTRHSFDGMSNVELVYLPDLEETALETIGFPYSSKTKVLRLPRCTTFGTALALNIGAVKLLDIARTGAVGGTELYNTFAAYTVLILRATSVVPLSAVDGRFVTASHFRSGGVGVDVYVPSNLVDEYKNATNWTILVNDYQTARFHALEGSIYEDPDYDYDIGMED